MSMMSGLLFGLLLIFSTTSAYFHKQSILSETEAIILEDQAYIRISPMDKANVSFKLHEGAKVKIIQQNDSWLQIEVNGNSGWIQEEEVKNEDDLNADVFNSKISDPESAIKIKQKA